MSQRDEREGLSPSPANILDIFTGDDDDDDDDMDSFHPSEEQSTDASQQDEEDSDADFAGMVLSELIKPVVLLLTSSRCPGVSEWH